MIYIKNAADLKYISQILFGEKRMIARIITFLISLTLITQLSFSQSGWFWQNPLPQGNDLHGLKMFDANTGYCYNYDNILKTTNGGENWQVLYTGYSTNLSGLSMIDANLGYVLLDSTRILKTVNGGINWSFVAQINGLNIPYGQFHTLYFLNQNTGFLLMRMSEFSWTGTKLLRTSNAGQNWSTIIADTSLELCRIQFLTAYTGYMVGQGHEYQYQNQLKVFKTTNGGVTWNSIVNNIALIGERIFFVNENTGYVGGRSLVSGEIYKTTNGGVNWIFLGALAGNYVEDIKFINENTGFALNYFGEVNKTTNGGLNWTWSYISYASGHNYIRELYFTDVNTLCGIGTGGLILKTTNGGLNWEKKSQGVDTWLWDVEFANSETGFAGGEYGKLLKTTNGGINWNLIQFPQENEFFSIEKIDPYNWYVASSFYSKVFKTSNLGLTWDTLNINIGGTTRIDFINASTGFGVCKYYYFFKTTNGGLTWLIYNNLNNGQNWALDFINENTGFAGGTKTYKTTNGGINWDTGVGTAPADIQFINSTTGYIATNAGKVLKTTNTGTSWTEVLVTNGYLNDINMVNENIGFATSAITAYKTTNGGLNWFQIRICSDNSLNVVFFTDTLTGYIVGSGGTIIKTTNGGGEPIGIQPISTEIPSQFILHQNYPNPFNPTTKIKFSIPPLKGARGMIVKLVIYDILGREIEILVNEQLSPGVYDVEWNGSNYSSGVYFYQLSINNEQLATKKMVLIK